MVGMVVAGVLLKQLGQSCPSGDGGVGSGSSVQCLPDEVIGAAAATEIAVFLCLVLYFALLVPDLKAAKISLVLTVMHGQTGGDGAHSDGNGGGGEPTDSSAGFSVAGAVVPGTVAATSTTSSSSGSPKP